MPLSQIKTNSIAAGNITTALIASGNITSALITSVANTAIVGRIATAQQPTGAVLKIVNMNYSTAVGMGTGAWIDTGLTLSITPSSTSSKIIVIANVGGLQTYNSSTGYNFQLVRDGTGIIGFGAFYGYPTSMYTVGGQLTYLDSPATTSSITYKVQHQRAFASGSGVVNGDGSTSFFTLMEIAG